MPIPIRVQVALPVSTRHTASGVCHQLGAIPDSQVPMYLVVMQIYPSMPLQLLHPIYPAIFTLPLKTPSNYFCTPLNPNLEVYLNLKVITLKLSHHLHFTTLI